MKVPVSILIPVKNEASNLPWSLASVAWADEIFVVDSQSSDGSQEFVEEFARGQIGKAETGNLKLETQVSSLKSQVSVAEVKLVQFHFNGTWPKKKNWALENLPFKHEWVFILDADEVLPPEAEQEIRNIVEESGKQKAESGNSGLKSSASADSYGATALKCNEGGQVSSLKSQVSAAEPPAGYWINRRFMFMGKWLKHAYYPNWNLRLFKHRLGRYEKLTDVDTASGDNEVHEHVVVNGKTGRLKCEMDHYAFPSVDVFVEKHNRYSNWEARVALDRFLKGSNQSLQSKEVGSRRRLKQLSQRLPFRPLQRFLYIYFWQRGFLDGIAGYHFARLHAVYEYLCVVKTVELKKTKHSKGVQKNDGKGSK